MRQRSKSDHNLTVHSFGLGAESGFFDLYIPYYRGFIFDGLASFDWASAQDWLNEERIYRFDRKHLTVEHVRCEVKRLEDMTTCPTLVKIDVQGFESNVLIGGLRTIRQHRPTFLIENDPEWNHEQILFPEGYRRAAYRDGRLELDAVGLGNT